MQQCVTHLLESTEEVLSSDHFKELATEEIVTLLVSSEELGKLRSFFFNVACLRFVFDRC